MDQKRKLKLRGLHTPRILIWMLGVLHGKVMKTATIDGRTGHITSSYITGKTKLFNEMNIKALSWLEQDLKEKRAEAVDLMTEEALLREKLETAVSVTAPKSVHDMRERDRNSRERQRSGERCSEILRRLAELDEEIRHREMLTNEKVAAIGEALQSRFSTYGHGMLLSPISAERIPPVEYEQAFAYYRAAHAREDTQRSRLLQEVYHHETV